MKILRLCIAVVAVTLSGLFCAYAFDTPSELSAFYAVPGAVRPGTETTFTFIFKIPMDTSYNPYLNIKMAGESDLSFRTYWDGHYSCKVSCTLPWLSATGTADLTLTGAKTADGKTLGDIVERINIAQGKY